MGYSSRRGRRPSEYASKFAHSYVVKDQEVQQFLTRCNLPKKAGDISFADHVRIPFRRVTDNPSRHIIAVDSGYSEVIVEKEFPSSTICFFQFGALIFSVEDLEGLTKAPFIDPEDISRLKNIQRLKLTLPIRNITLKPSTTMVDSVRNAVYGFFRQDLGDEDLAESLKWFIFQEYGIVREVWTLSSCPSCGARDIPLRRSQITENYTFPCEACGSDIFLTDVFRLHEAVDNELGAGGIVGYVATGIEQILIVHLMRLILKAKPSVLKHVLFIKDGPLAFFGQTANMHDPMRELCRFLFGQHDLYLAGLEKSGPFVEHADEISQLLDAGTVLILDDEYIYRYIVPGKADPLSPYGRSTYYGNKLIFKTPGGSMYVASLPTTKPNWKPAELDFKNLQAILTNIEMLRCDMYDNSLIPVALANKLISLANHPSSRILQKFATETVPH
jgi:hypothetical protein